MNQNQVECPICGARGLLKNNGRPEIFDSDYRRFSDQEMDNHFKGWLVEMKKCFATEKGHLKELQKGYLNQSWWIRRFLKHPISR